MTSIACIFEPCAAPKPPRGEEGGVTLVEMLITVVIGAIALFALAVPLVARSSFEISGNAQAEAQRDAQLGLEAMERVARASNRYTVGGGGNSITFTDPAGCVLSFQGGPAFGSQLLMSPGCGAAATVPLIDGNRSQVTAFAVTTVRANRLVRVNLTVLHRGRETESLQTELFLRNAP